MSHKHDETHDGKGHGGHEHEHEHSGHEHDHEHGEHSHDHGHAHGHSHEAGHDDHDHGEHCHGHEHEHDHEHLAHDAPASNSHRHCHEHSHGVSHTHCHEHAHAPAHSHPCRVLTLRPHSGLSGDMMLAGLAVLAGVDTPGLHALAAELRIPALEGCVALESRSVHSVAGYGCAVTLPHEHAHRTLADIRTLLETSALPEEARELALRCFALLAEAEAAVHGKSCEDVTFHEVGALDSILDIALVCRLYTVLAAQSPLHLVCGPLPVADGQILCAHGHMPSPAPAVLRLLEGVPVVPYAGSGETVTPTALALLKALGADFGRWPAMTVQTTVISYGTKVFENAPNGAVWALGEGLR